MLYTWVHFSLEKYSKPTLLFAILPILKVDGQYRDADLHGLQHLTNHPDCILHVEIRNGLFDQLDRMPYNIYDHQVRQALYFNGIMIFETDELTHLLTGAAIGKLFMLRQTVLCSPSVNPRSGKFTYGRSAIWKS